MRAASETCRAVTAARLSTNLTPNVPLCAAASPSAAASPATAYTAHASAAASKYSCSGATARNAAMTEPSRQPEAVIFGNSGVPFATATVQRPSET